MFSLFGVDWKHSKQKLLDSTAFIHMQVIRLHECRLELRFYNHNTYARVTIVATQ